MDRGDVGSCKSREENAEQHERREEKNWQKEKVRSDEEGRRKKQRAGGWLVGGRGRGGDFHAPVRDGTAVAGGRRCQSPHSIRTKNRLMRVVCRIRKYPG